ncbi:MAG: phage tail tip lysozyme [Coriobacteriia bacterium]|nr:phage tail tip lysozyme [Coriobacteriia bacterium]
MGTSLQNSYNQAASAFYSQLNYAYGVSPTSLAAINSIAGISQATANAYISYGASLALAQGASWGCTPGALTYAAINTYAADVNATKDSVNVQIAVVKSNKYYQYEQYQAYLAYLSYLSYMQEQYYASLGYGGKGDAAASMAARQAFVPGKSNPYYTPGKAATYYVPPPPPLPVNTGAGKAGGYAITPESKAGSTSGLPIEKIPATSSNNLIGKANNPSTIVDNTRFSFPKADEITARIATYNGYATNDYLPPEQIEVNARIVYNYLMNQGWSREAAVAVLANLYAESGINPGRWQSGVGPGYGLAQWDPASKYYNWALENGYSATSMLGQLEYLLFSMQLGQGEWLDEHSYVQPEYSMPMDEFISSNSNPEYLALVFMYCYERPTDQRIKAREDAAEEWYDYFPQFRPETIGGLGIY